MKFTFSWLKEHLETNESLENILVKLTSLGLVVDKVENKADVLAAFTICQVEEAKKHPDADRLQVCRVNTGEEVIQIVCGAPNARTGMKAVLARPGSIIPSTQQVLKVGKVRGVESFGMMCSARELLLGDDEDGIIEVHQEDAPIGTSYAKWLGLDETIIDIEITPNRGDCLGVHGIARDLAAAGMGTLKPLAHPQVKADFPCPIKLSVNPEAAPFFSGRVIRGLKNGPSPAWLQQKLTAIGLRPISALVDITNFFLHDQARPLHVFDLKKIKGNLDVRLSDEGESFQALDEKTYSLKDDMTVIADDSGVISLGGIMGGESTGCDDETDGVFLESAFFDPVRSAITGRTLGILSDSRYRFERGVDPESTLPGLDRATQMILNICGGKASDVVFGGDVPKNDCKITFNPSRVKTLGGMELEAKHSIGILERLGYQIEKRGEQACVLAPSWRFDVENEADLVEDVLRVEGYDKIPSLTCGCRPEKRALLPLQERRFMIRDRLAGRGLIETVTWSFLSKQEAKLFGGGGDDLLLMNPISQDLEMMRPSLLPNLLKALLYNRNRGQNVLGFYEVGPQYASTASKDQHMMASGLRAGTILPTNWCDKSRPVDLYDAKADVYSILEIAKIDPQIERTTPKWYHPGRSGTLKLGPLTLGYFGELHPLILKEMGITGAVVGFELFVDRIPLPKKKTSAKSKLDLSPYQAVERDFAFLVDQDVPADALLKTAKKVDPALVESVTLFDVFEMEDSRKSLAIRVRLQPKADTLTDEQIQAYSQKLVALVSQNVNGVLRQ